MITFLEDGIALCYGDVPFTESEMLDYGAAKEITQERTPQEYSTGCVQSVCSFIRNIFLFSTFRMAAARDSSDPILIYIRFNSQHAFSLEVDPRDSVNTIRQEISEKHGIPEEDIRIIFQGKILDNSASIQVDI